MYEMWTLGFLIGLQHALEADHLMAMATLASGRGTVGAVARRGLAWGLGHTATLLALGGTALLLGSLVPDELATTLEFAVGVMLVVLGADVLWRLHVQRVHLHPHLHHALAPIAAHPVHAQPHTHIHAHSLELAPAAAHGHDPHRHAHRAAFPLRALCVGMMHGMAGSAAIVVLTLHTVRSPAQGLLYIVVFGIGSIIGMGVLGTAIGVPLGWSARSVARAARGVHALLGCTSAGMGLWMMYYAGFLTNSG
jgi:ABC-type nickel/cobalt efflux system permease component RcnA